MLASVHNNLDHLHTMIFFASRKGSLSNFDHLELIFGSIWAHFRCPDFGGL